MPVEDANINGTYCDVEWTALPAAVSDLAVTADGFVVLGRFDAESGAVEARIEPGLGRVGAVRLSVREQYSENWAILSEVHLRPSS